MDILNITEKPQIDETIQEYEYQLQANCWH